MQKKTVDMIASGIALVWALIQMILIIKPGGLLPTQMRAIHLGFALVLLWLTKPLTFKRLHLPAAAVWTGKILLSTLSAAICAYILMNAERYDFYSYGYSNIDKIVSVIGILLVLYAAYRTLGPALVVITMAFIAYALLGKYIPGNFGHRGYQTITLATKLFLTTDGVFGSILGTSATLVFIYLVFGGFLQVMGGGKFFTDIAYAGFGSKRGGPAKMAVISSCLFGSISGSTIANVVTTGTITIPLMKDIGYKPAFAGAVEAVASTGGQLMPPIMGATAFIMAQMMNVAYAEVVKAAIVPALLFYLALLLMVDFEAAKTGMKGMSKDTLPSIKAVFAQGWHFLVPFVVMLYVLFVMKYSAQFAALYAIVIMVILVGIRTRGKNFLRDVLDSLISGAKSAVTVAIPCACIGMVVGVILLTGVGLEFSSLMRHLSGGALFPLLLIMMITSLVLGLGVPTTAAYILVQVIAVPSMLELGVNAMAANLFCLYFAVISSITPPVALAAITAANIAKSDPFKTGWVAVRLGISGFVIPFVFVYQPGLLLSGNVVEILTACISCTLGVIALSGALQQYFFGALEKWEMALLLVIGFALITPSTILDAAGYALFAVFTVWRKISLKKQGLPMKW